MSTGSMVAGLIDSRARVHPLQRIFSFPAMLACLLALLAVLTVRGRFDDPDMWYHLKTGQVIWTTHSIPVTDLFSYTTRHHADIPHEWLAQTFIYGAYRLGDYGGLMLWLCVLSSALLIAGYGLCWFYSGNAKVAFLGALTIWLFATIGFSVRPQMVGYLLLIVELFLLHLGRTRNALWFAGLPPLFALWVNCHGSFAAGLGVAGSFLLCSFFGFETNLLVCERWEPSRRRVLALAFVLSIAALFANPIGVRQVMYPFDAMFHMSTRVSVVDEWQPLDFSDGRSVAFAGVVLSIVVLAATREKKLYLFELLLLALGSWQAASHRRLLFLFGILAAPTLTRMLSDAWEGYEAAQDRPLPNAIIIVASVAIAFFAFPENRELQRQIEEHSPARAVEFLKSHAVSGNMLNEYVYGGYLIWAAPEHPVFVDGRGDVFNTVGVLDDYGKWAMLESDPQELLSKYKVDFCLLSRGSPMVRVLPLMHWTTIYSDENAVILVRGDGANTRAR